MSKVTPVGTRDIGQVKDVQLLLLAATRNVHREQDGDADGSANEAGDDSHLEQAQEQKAIERVVGENIAVGDLDEGGDPAEEARR